MSTSLNKFDSIEHMIFETNLRIISAEIKSNIDLLLIYLNTGHILAFNISSYKNLAKANSEALQQFELISNGIGIHWPKIDEDLSLKGFLKDTLQSLVLKKQLVVA